MFCGEKLLAVHQDRGAAAQTEPITRAERHRHDLCRETLFCDHPFQGIQDLREATRAALEVQEFYSLGSAAASNLFYNVAGLDLLEVVPEQGFAQLEYLEYPIVGDGIVGVATRTANLNVAAPAQTAQVVGDARLRRP